MNNDTENLSSAEKKQKEALEKIFKTLEEFGSVRLEGQFLEQVQNLIDTPLEKTKQ